MAANRFDLAAEMPIINTYVPIDFNNLYLIGAVQRLAVDKAINDLNEAITTFGEFRSPSSVDTLRYYDLSLGRMQGLIDEVTANPDSIKDPSFRSRLFSNLNSLDYAKLSMLKESADNLRLGLKTRAEMEAKGLYNRNWDESDIASYDTLTLNRVFDDITPVAYMNANLLSDAYFDNMKPGTIGPVYEDGIKYIATGNTIEDLKAIANAHMSDLIATPQGLMYMKDFLKRRNGNYEKAEEDFKNMIVASQMSRILRPTLTVDPVWLATAKANGKSGSSNSNDPILHRLDLINTGLNNRLDLLYEKNMTEEEKLNHARGVLNLLGQLQSAIALYQNNPTSELLDYIQELQEGIITLNFGTLQDANRREALKAFKEHARFDASTGSSKPEDNKLYNTENYLNGVNAALKAISVPYSVSENDLLLIQQGGVPHKVTENDGTVRNVYSYSTSTGFMLPENVFNGITQSVSREPDRVGFSVFRDNELYFQQMLEGGELSNIEFEPQPEVLRLGTGQNAIKGKIRIPVGELENKLGTGTMRALPSLFRVGELDTSLEQTYNAKKVKRKVGKDDVEYMEFDAYKVLAPEDGTAPESNTAANTMWVNSPNYGGIGSSTTANNTYTNASLLNLKLQ